MQGCPAPKFVFPNYTICIDTFFATKLSEKTCGNSNYLHQ